jgi:hypothetical protein
MATGNDTPRTDSVELHYRQMEDKDAPSYVVPAEFARQLERELAEYKRMLDEALDTIKRWEER